MPLDFVSFHVKGQPTIEAGNVTMGLRSELLDADRGFEIVAKHARLRSLPIILSEADPEGWAACSSKVNPANNYRNGTLYPAYTAAAYKGLPDLSRQRGVNLIAMLSWSFEFDDREYFGSPAMAAVPARPAQAESPQAGSPQAGSPQTGLPQTGLPQAGRHHGSSTMLEMPRESVSLLQCRW